MPSSKVKDCVGRVGWMWALGLVSNSGGVWSANERETTEFQGGLRGTCARGWWHILEDPWVGLDPDEKRNVGQHRQVSLVTLTRCMFRCCLLTLWVWMVRAVVILSTPAWPRSHWSSGWLRSPLSSYLCSSVTNLVDRWCIKESGVFRIFFGLSTNSQIKTWGLIINYKCLTLG